LLIRTGQPQTGIERRFECRRSFEGIDLESFDRFESDLFLRIVTPEKFGSLPFGKFDVRFGKPLQNRRDGLARQIAAGIGDQSITETEQVIAGVDSRGDTVTTMQGPGAITILIVILDIVVDE